MRFNSRILLAVFALSFTTLVSCSKGGKNVSSTTGWEYNNPDLGGFEYQSGYEQETGPGLVFVEGGTFIMGRVEQDVIVITSYSIHYTKLYEVGMVASISGHPSRPHRERATPGVPLSAWRLDRKRKRPRLGGVFGKWWPGRESNPLHGDFQSP